MLDIAKDPQKVRDFFENTPEENKRKPFTLLQNFNKREFFSLLQSSEYLVKFRNEFDIVRSRGRCRRI
ncbi:MAG: hypothetical protein KGZ75_04020 [Syntrophomonadaceae bacterium]|nr:hypothetical protein [Syntrophomonadaceae bacterium]